MLKGYYIVIFGVDKILSPCPGGGEGKKSKTQRREGKQRKRKGERKRGEGGMVGRGRKGSG